MSLNPRIADWRGRVVWIVGASSGIGLATAALLHARGAVVAVSARNEAALSRFAQEHPGAIALPMKAAGDSGKLFGSVTAADVVTAIKKAGGPSIDKRSVRMPKAHIKEAGSHTVAVHLHPEVEVTVTLDIVGRH